MRGERSREEEEDRASVGRIEMLAGRFALRMVRRVRDVSDRLPDLINQRAATPPSGQRRAFRDCRRERPLLRRPSCRIQTTAIMASAGIGPISMVSGTIRCG